MLHEPAVQCEKDFAASYKQRLGVWMFLLYALVYAGFVAINLIDPAMMESRIIFGLNLAVVYGVALILFALILAVIYNLMCLRRERLAAESNEGGN